MDVLFNDPDRLESRRELRKRQTNAESILWKQLRLLKYAGVRMRRQYGIEPFIVDFYCPAKRLVIEVDGEYHNDPEQIAYDADRSAYFSNLNIKVIRFTNEAVENDVDACMDIIRQELGDSTSPLPPGLGGRGRGMEVR